MSFQIETYFLRQTISFQAIDSFVGQDAVFPRSLTAARSRDDVVDIPFVRRKFSACVLAMAAIPFPDSFRRQLWTSLRNSIVSRQYEHRWDTYQSAHSSHCVIFFTDREMNPVLPFHGAHIAAANHVERSGIPICHHAKSLRRRFGIDRLPISVQHY